MKQINNLIVVEVPDDAYDFELSTFDSLRCTLKNGSYYRVCELQEDENYEILGKLSELSEEECSRFVEKVMNNQHYQNYNYKTITDRWVKTTRESLMSLLQSNGVDTSKNLLLIEKL